jgi:NAD(P)-dependent dehydrogenase (short-subunit alcohol dehydrogenase family)
MKLSNDISAIVTGGASGLGEATARALAAAGVRVAILDRQADRGEKVASETSGVFVSTDVTDPASVRAAIASVTERLGPPRIAVCCAGVATAARTVDRDGKAHDPDVFARAIGVNLLGTFHVASQAAAVMSGLEPLGGDGERGVIVTTASVAAFEGQIGQIAYAASKGAVAAMTLPMARDLAGRGIRVVSIAPGLFRTPMLAGLPQEAQDSLGAQVPFPARLGDPGEFATLVLHIVENAMLNGSVIRLDGAIRMAPR